MISICLKNPERIIDCENEELFPEHFAIDAHRYIYMAILYLFSKKIKPSPIAIFEVITDKKAKEKIEEIGGLEYISLLQQADITEDNLKIFCMKIKQAHMRRTIYEICEYTKEEMISEDAEVLNPQELISRLENKVIDLSVQNTQTNEVYKMGDNVEERLAKRAEKPNSVPGLETGWTQFDRYTNGGQAGDLIAVCARSKTGKSVTLTNWATKFGIIDRVPVLYCDSEMTSEEQEDRQLAILTGVPHQEIVSGMYVVDTEYGTAKEKVAKIKEAVALMKAGEYYHVYMPQFTIEKVMSLARKYKIQHGIGALFFDYIKLPANQVSTLKSVQEWQYLGFFTSGLKDIGGLLRIPIYTAVQENRSNPKSKEKDETNVAGSDRILQLATKLIFLYNKDDETIAKEGIVNGNQQLYIAYQRNGISDAPPINIMFHKHIIRQEEV